MSNPIKNITIVGGGSAGWMTAAYLSRFLSKEHFSISLIESTEIETIGVGEATIPPIHSFNAALGIDEATFLKETNATIKLGIEFTHWSHSDSQYFHPFGTLGRATGKVPFHHYWIRSLINHNNTNLAQYSIETAAAYNSRFQHPSRQANSPLENFGYAYHFDAAMYARLLKKKALEQGVNHIQKTVRSITLKDDNGFIDKLIFDDKTEVQGDLFIDCTGFAALLIEKTLHVGYEDWSDELFCNRAIAIPTDEQHPHPYTQAIAHPFGWQWRIPLQHRTGNGIVYSSQHISDDEAEHTLRKNLKGQPLKDPNYIRFTTGKRKEQWAKNCIAVGLSGGFLEPLESTSLHLTQLSITRILDFIPHGQITQPAITAFNNGMNKTYQEIKDFIILHYKLTQRDDSEFWRACKAMPINDTLKLKIELFQKTGNIIQDQEEFFRQTSWLAVMYGQGITPENHHPMVNDITEQDLFGLLNGTSEVIKQTVQHMPTHHALLQSIK